MESSEPSKYWQVHLVEKNIFRDITFAEVTVLMKKEQIDLNERTES